MSGQKSSSRRNAYFFLPLQGHVLPTISKQERGLYGAQNRYRRYLGAPAELGGTESFRYIPGLNYLKTKKNGETRGSESNQKPGRVPMDFARAR